MGAFHPTRFLVPAAALAAALAAGCASTRLDAQWTDPQAAPGSLRGARVMVACEARDLVIRRICQDRMASEVTARGGTPVVAPDTSNEAPGRPLGAEQYLPAARNANAKAVLTHYVTEADVSVNPPPSVSFGIGGFGFGGGGGGVSTGVGVTTPVGGARTNVGYAVTSNLLDASSGKVLLTAKASAPPSGDVNAQLNELTKVVFGAADNAKLF
ncbi:MAG TPA: hypothetical protein VFK10_13950 [Burkholderiaceae bacterium]|nr:hypothetical protein [Burkholderiaceae bacterium]